MSSINNQYRGTVVPSPVLDLAGHNAFLSSSAETGRMRPRRFSDVSSATAAAIRKVEVTGNQSHTSQAVSKVIENGN